MKHSISLFAILALSVAAANAQSLPTMADIPAGHFWMGSMGEGENYDEWPVHRVDITQPFKMAVTEVTNAQYEEFCPEHKQLRGKDGLCNGDDEAVTNITWHDAMNYCQWLSERTGRSFRLPTEAEWEYACRAGTTFPFFTGDGLPGSMHKNQQKARTLKPVSLSVGKTAANAFGLHDMHGNVEEWCLDWYAPYSANDAVDPVTVSGGLYRVTRGGSHNTPENYLRSANRSAMIPMDRHSMTGFRIVEAPYPKGWRIDESHHTAVKHETHKWKATSRNKPVFCEPKVYVINPHDNVTPFYLHNHQPAVTWTDGGDLLAIWFSADQENGRDMVVLSSRLHPGAESWTPAELFFKVPDRNMTGSSLLNDRKGTLYHLNGVEAAGDWQNLAMAMRRSHDGGVTWSRPTIIEPEHTMRHQVIQGPIVLADGTLVQLCDAGPGSEDGTSIHLSHDGGDNWYDPWDGAPLPQFTEGGTGSTIAGIHAGIVQLADGSLMAMGRGIDNAVIGTDGKKYLPISISTNQGKTWTYHASPFPPIQGHQRLVLLRLQEGPIMLASFTDHPTRTPRKEQGMMFTDTNGNTFRGYGAYVALSYDEGRTWPVRRLLTDGKERHLNGGAWTQFFKMDATHAEPRGYLAATQSPDGMIHLLSSRIHYAFNLAWIESIIK
ncbi:MAG: SUMF1/EgtB/PvdO family nonheme iron enzyme [Muribaculaceae bacterium]